MKRTLAHCQRWWCLSVLVRRRIPARFKGLLPYTVAVLDPDAPVPWLEPSEPSPGVAWCDSDVARRRGDRGSIHDDGFLDDDDDDVVDMPSDQGDDETEAEPPPPPPAPGPGIRLSCVTANERLNTTYSLDPAVRGILRTARQDGYHHVMYDAVVGTRRELRLASFDCRARRR